MIRPLRRVHRVLFAALVVILPAALGWTLLHRVPPPSVPVRDDEPLALSIVTDADGGRALRVTAPGSRPEILVYLDPGGAPEPNAASRLLGVLRDGKEAFDLPPGAHGTVLLYSPVLQRTLVAHALAP